MRLIEQVALIQQACQKAARPLVFVPTMGALHEGHASLFRQARSLAGKEGCVVVSLFLNPKQFNSAQDLALYPQPFEKDKIMCEREGVDVIFHPSAAAFYAPDHSIDVEEVQLSRVLCGASRPGHFKGVTTVLTKMFHLIMPTQAVFGEKDWQQLVIVRRLVRDLNIPVTVIAAPTLREEDGLAMSSRNERLSQSERAVAPMIYQTLEQVREQVQAGERKVALLLEAARKRLESLPGSCVDYFEIREEETLAPLEEILECSKARLFVAIKLGETRLIDNISLSVL